MGTNEVLRGDEARVEGLLAAERIVRDVARQYEEQAAQAGSGGERAYHESCVGAAQRCADAVRGARIAVDAGPSSTAELARLMEHLMANHAGELAPNENPVDAAIRLLLARSGS